MRRNPRVESAESCGRWAAEQWPGNKELYRDGRGRSGARHPVWRAHRREQVRRKRMPMRWCRSQKPAKSTASAFPVVAGCHPAVLTLTRPSENGFRPKKALRIPRFAASKSSTAALHNRRGNEHDLRSVPTQ